LRKYAIAVPRDEMIGKHEIVVVNEAPACGDVKIPDMFSVNRACG
jgi:hypothetical protein